MLKRNSLNCKSCGHKIRHMKLLTFLLLLPVSLLAQERGGQQGRGAAPAVPPKNLKVLAANTEIPFVMRSFNEALGVQCTHCHVQGDFAADTKPEKEMARKMIKGEHPSIPVGQLAWWLRPRPHLP